MAIAINKKGMQICEKTKNKDKMLSELKDQGEKLQQEKYGAASDEVIKKIINNESYSHITDDLMFKCLNQVSPSMVFSGLSF